ncbi:MAG: SDR family NAD(P)-dependent oxidoreductase [Cyclobacteriaceae bacterium]
MQRFDGQVALVTGAARGIGRGVAKRLAQEGASVILIDVLKADLEQTIKELQSQGLAVEGSLVDITNEDEVKKTIAQMMARHHRLDVMVNCAGIVGPSATKIAEYTLEEFKKVLDVNLTGAFNVTKYVIPAMLDNNYGRILHIASIGGKEGNPGMAGYAASKSGLMGLVKGIGKEYAETGITVNGLAPAVISTPMNLETAPEMLKYMTDKIPMKRLGTIEEVAAISCWIVSKEASFNTGFVFDLSGGRATY